MAQLLRRLPQPGCIVAASHHLRRVEGEVPRRLESGDGRFREFHIKEKYKTVREALKLFKDDELLSEPGERFTFA